jgi:aspartate oxidase
MILALRQLKNMEKEINKLYGQGVNRKTIELKNLVQVAILITSAALARKESVCAHFLVKK